LMIQMVEPPSRKPHKAQLCEQKVASVG
jgi:hypothetical protein